MIEKTAVFKLLAFYSKIFKKLQIAVPYNGLMIDWKIFTLEDEQNKVQNIETCSARTSKAWATRAAHTTADTLWTTRTNWAPAVSSCVYSLGVCSVVTGMRLTQREEQMRQL
jgi:hypothetical protein